MGYVNLTSVLVEQSGSRLAALGDEPAQPTSLLLGELDLQPEHAIVALPHLIAARVRLFDLQRSAHALLAVRLAVRRLDDADSTMQKSV